MRNTPKKDIYMIETGFVSVLPPIIAIVLAFITKEVYSSLFIGVFSGMAIYVAYAHEPFVAVFSHMIDMMAEKIADNSYMIIFLALLWAVVTLVSRAGGSQAYGRWAGKRLKSKRSALLATSLFGLLVFIDDKGRAKMDIALCKGKKEFDKRQTLKEKEDKREMDRAMKVYK